MLDFVLYSVGLNSELLTVLTVHSDVYCSLIYNVLLGRYDIQTDIIIYAQYVYIIFIYNYIIYINTHIALHRTPGLWCLTQVWGVITVMLRVLRYVYFKAIGT